MKNTVQKYLFYLELQNYILKKYVLQHILTTHEITFNLINESGAKYKKMQKSFQLLHFLYI